MDINPSDLNPIVDGKYTDPANTNEAGKKSTDNSLGKEAFLKLLVTQMEYQDPLNPQADTEFISQLAQFSALEQMQNLNEAFSNSSAMNLVGRTVTVTQTDSSGKSHTVTGVVDFVNKNSKGKTFVNIEGVSYSSDDVTEIYDDYYLVEKKMPKVEAADLTFNHSAPQDIEVEMTLGEDEQKASTVAVMLGDKTIDSSYLSYKDGVLTIDRDAFKEFEAGKYQTYFVFNGSGYSTTVADKVTITITGIRPSDN